MKRATTCIWTIGKDGFATCDCNRKFGYAESKEFIYCPMCGGKIGRRAWNWLEPELVEGPGFMVNLTELRRKEVAEAKRKKRTN